MTWWNDAMNVFMELTAISIESEHLFKKNKTWRVEGMDFRLRDADVSGNSPELEEQLWSFRNGLSNLVFQITIPTPQRPKNPKKWRRNR